MKNHKQNKLGIYVCGNSISNINNIGFEINSISYTGNCKFRIINHFMYGFFYAK